MILFISKIISFFSDKLNILSLVHTEGPKVALAENVPSFQYFFVASHLETNTVVFFSSIARAFWLIFWR